MRKFIGVAMLVGMLTVLAGCTINVGTDGTTEDTSTTTSTTSTSSSDWPSYITLNPDWEVTGTSNSTYADSIYITKTQSCDSCTKDEVVKYYRDALSAQGWTEYSFTDSSSAEWGDSVTVSFEKGDDEYVSVYYSVWEYLGTTIDISYSKYTY